MIDKITAIPREKIGLVIGSLSDDQMIRVNRSRRHVLGLGLRVVS